MKPSLPHFAKLAAMNSKLRISRLPLPPSKNIITHNLTPDPHTPTPSHFREKVLTTNPSIQRRARLLDAGSHFSYVAPLPLPFPYEIEAPIPPEIVQNKGAYVEKWLSAREAVHPRPLADASPVLMAYYPKNRDQTRELIGLAETGLRDCVPHLDVGDAFGTLGVPSLVPTDAENGINGTEHDGPAASARQELVDVLGGHAVLMSPPAEDGDGVNSVGGFAPWSLRYSGHQFGSWAGQLGDGRAISIREPSLHSC